MTQLRCLAGLAPATGQPAPLSSGTPAPAKSWPLLKAGTRGTDVRTTQYLLNAVGHRLDADSAFGPATTSAVKAFQTHNRLDADGVVGPNTWNKIVADATTHTPAPSTPIPSGNGKLTQRQALAQLAAAGIKRPVGRTSLEGIRARTIQGVIALRRPVAARSSSPAAPSPATAPRELLPRQGLQARPAYP
ncbi:peptidoglycan-binding protein [Streptomyces globisporus]|uniref:peptidoglycan-binding domain-containing protein n=1 Tax=Streptomyces globisporus TaxID=1908 RepID=UPI000AA7ACEC|nr:peptidoglycan-binding domain-containing protein [Streptomyces globisporus]